MNDRIDLRTRIWASVATVVGVGFLVGLELIEEPEASVREVLFETLKALPVVLTSVGVALLVQVTGRQHDEHLQVIRDLEIARVQGQRWRSEARSHLDGLGQAINEQFSR